VEALLSPGWAELGPPSPVEAAPKADTSYPQTEDPLFTDGYNLVAFDMRGHGLTQGGARPKSYDAWSVADDIAAGMVSGRGRRRRGGAGSFCAREDRCEADCRSAWASGPRTSSASRSAPSSLPTLPRRTPTESRRLRSSRSRQTRTARTQCWATPSAAR
jgi:hypothetical protein